MSDAVLTLNAGSSSLKFALFSFASAPALILHGQIESLTTQPHFLVKSPQGTALYDHYWPSETGFERVLTDLIAWIETHLGTNRLVAIGHRVVHGGNAHIRPERITTSLIEDLSALSPLAPLHQPHNLQPIAALHQLHPDLPQFACFDTAFHASLPQVARLFALPQSLPPAIRRYGFHGLSYEYIARKLKDIAPRLSTGKTIIAHLGNGASLCALSNGRSIDTTFAFTALDGLMMGTRCGALDPGVVLYLLQQGWTVDAVQTLLYQQSGLLGVSGLSSDMRTLLASDQPEARLAIDLFVHRASREIGAMMQSLKGLDGLVFTAGIGENAAPIRARLVENLSWLGAELDHTANDANAALISTRNSAMEIRVIPTDEEAMIAIHTCELLLSKTA